MQAFLNVPSNTLTVSNLLTVTPNLSNVLSNRVRKRLFRLFKLMSSSNSVNLFLGVDFVFVNEAVGKIAL